jgi:multidrug efflux pump subunit AcrB
MNFVKASLKHRQVTISVILIVFAFGINSLLNMPRREDPKITIPGGLVVAYFPGADAAMVEDQVTGKLEEYLFQFEEIQKEKTYSVTSDGMVVIHVWLMDNVRKPDIFWNKLRHQLMVVKAVDLPQGVVGPAVNSDFGDTESMIVGISSDTADYTQLKEYLGKLEDQLRSIPEVSKLKLIGEQKEQIQVAFRSEDLVQYDITLPQVVKILQSQNSIGPSGEIRSDETVSAIHTTGYFKSENDIKDQIVGFSRTGAVVRLGDIADMTRKFQDPESKITVDGKKALMLTLQMHEGKNIVKSGKKINRKLEEFAMQLPANMELTTLVDQPSVVRKNISEFLREFLLAILAVIIVIFLLLPFSIAAVSATAIPMTVSVTFALMHFSGIELHQVSLAALIMVLGLVVDDAIIIADNYVDLLDRGKDRWTAAWQSATELVIPVMTATITIIGSFLPIVILQGTVGEFIRALPITVTIALSSSFIVAMFLTPLLCYLFIKKGLKNTERLKDRKTGIILESLQRGYNKAIDWCLRHSRFTITASLLTILFAALLFKTSVRQKFFPEAERDQFIVELWMPTGTRLEKTEKAILKIEKIIKTDKRVKSYATFIGRSAPRFYYNYSPEMPESNYAQILVNTTGDKETESLYEDLTRQVSTLVPEGKPQVKLMKQGQPEAAPVEVRISGYNIKWLKQLGDEIENIFRDTEGSRFIRSDFKEDYYGIDVDLKEAAGRLGFTSSIISQTLYMGFAGYPVSTLYEGENPIDIVLRLDNKEQQHTGDVENIYLSSPITGAQLPMREIADLKPEWQPGRIIRRNGIRTLTIQSDVTQGSLPSELLGKIRPKIEKLDLPGGYEIKYGGEYANKNETFLPLIKALIISIIIIFIVLMFQFRNWKEVGLVMLTIPLSLFGAIFGLYITGNEFGFTAFTGLIALSGIVVRNAIILIDHTNELIKNGLEIPSAALQAGKRRLRPIFLTAMAAAFGVLPMILSGSSLWSPTASVIAFGVIWSMLISTLSIPVLYTVTIKSRDKENLVPIINTENSAE